MSASNGIEDKNVFIDVKGILDKRSINEERIVYWRV